MSALKILAIDTATEVCSVALHLHGEVSERAQLAPRAHSALAPDMAREMLREAGLQWAQLDALAVDIGPGAFTGLRIGIGLAQGLAYAAELAVIPVVSLEALAFAAGAHALPAIDARMGQVYYARYEKTPRGLRTLTPPSLATPQQVRAEGEGVTGIGSGWKQYAPQLLQACGGAVSEWRDAAPRAADIARLAAARGMPHALPPMQLTACYVREQVAAKSR